MPKSKIFLPDVNVWLALASPRHIHSPVCSEWLDTVYQDDLVFCRVTQMGLLRLLTNASVMGGDVLASRDAWRVYQSMLTDERIGFVPEPLFLEEQWKKLTSQKQPTPNVWTDAYLTAFAHSAAMRLVTLDRAARILDPEALILH